MRMRIPGSWTLSILSTLAVFFSSSAEAQWVQSPPDQDVVIRGGWLFDGIRDTRVRNTGIVIRNGVLAEVGAELAAGCRRWQR